MSSASYLLSVFRSCMGVMTSRVFGLIRDMVIAAVYGATGITDIFFVAFAIPNLFRQFFAEGAIASAFIPFLCDKRAANGEKAANTYLTQLILVQALLVTLLCILMMILAPYMIMLFMPGIANDSFSIATGATILRIVMPYLFFVSVSGLLSGWLNVSGSYYVAYASTSCLNLMMIAGAAIGYYNGGSIYSLAISVFTGGMFQFVVVYIYAHMKGFRFGAITPRDPDIKNTYKLLIPSLAGVGVSQLNFLVGRILASFLQPGSISWLFYANRLFQFPLGVFSVTISTVGMTELSKARTDGDMVRVSALIDKSIISLLMIMLPASIGLIGLAEQIIGFIYGGKAFTNYDILNTSMALQMYSAGLIFYSFASIFTRVYHSEKNIKTPVKIAIVAFVVNALMILMTMKPMGHVGIALSSTVAAVVNTVLLYKGIRGYRFSIKNNIMIIAKILVASYLMTACMIIGKITGLHMFVIVAVCVAVYFGSLHLMKVKIREVFK